MLLFFILSNRFSSGPGIWVTLRVKGPEYSVVKEWRLSERFSSVEGVRLLVRKSCAIVLLCL